MITIIGIVILMVLVVANIILAYSNWVDFGDRESLNSRYARFEEEVNRLMAEGVPKEEALRRGLEKTRRDAGFKAFLREIFY